MRKISSIVCAETVWIMLSRPHLIPGTVYATLESVWEAETEFGNSHGAHNFANAYKHAVWNALIAFYIQRFYRKPEAALAWAKKITDMHEDCFVNDPAARAMDLKNNAIGRTVYLDLYVRNIRNKKQLIQKIRNSEDLIFFE